MRISCYFGRGGAAFIKPAIVAEKQGIEGDIELLIDTGASKTVILDRDAQFLGIDYSQLKEPDIRMGGIGGKVDTYVLPRVELIFETDEGVHVGSFDQIFVLKHEVTDRDTKRWLNSIPSLLGRDFLDRFALFIDKENNVINITDEHVQSNTFHMQKGGTINE